MQPTNVDIISYQKRYIESLHTDCRTLCVCYTNLHVIGATKVISVLLWIRSLWVKASAIS